ncbi:MAG: endonuclease/exonuclease/phosphatase family protein [Deltaproteobacteria bacterium]|nr:endonuclease/exonuclease/phosphatase family protein [Deltaproteobacteria bacterium]
MAATNWLLFSSAFGVLALAMIARSVGHTEGGPRLQGVAATAPAPAAPLPGQLRIITWNIAHGRGTSLHQALLDRAVIRANLTAIGSALKREQADLVALQEADGPSQWSGHLDQPRLLATGAGLGHRYRGSHGRGLGPVALDYGTALLSRWPLDRPRSIRFDRSWRDNKGFVVAGIEIPGSGVVVDVVSLHLDFMSPAVRRRQVRLLVEELRDRDRPLIVVGDFNCDLRERGTLSTLVEALELQPGTGRGGPTFPAGQPRRRIDWILVSSDLEIVDHRTLSDPLSDHRAVVADIALKPDADNRRRMP